MQKNDFLIKSIGLVLIIVISMMFTSSSSNDLEGLTTEQLTTEQLTTEQLTTEQLTTEEEVFNKFIKDFENIKKQTTDLAKKTVTDRDVFGNKTGNKWSFWEEHPSIAKAIDNSQQSYLSRAENQLKQKTNPNSKKMADCMIVLREYYKYMKNINIKSLEIKKSNSESRKKIFMDEFDHILQALKKVGADKSS